MLADHKHNISLAEARLHLLDPQNILKRGYSITYHEGKALTDPAGVNPGERIVTRLYKGEINSEIKSKKE